MITLSKRLAAIAELVTPGNVVCDVGTDHGYIPIYLVQQGICPRAIAMDLREGPLARAKEHIGQCGLSDRIEARLSDGTRALLPGEADAIVIAGMGGELIIRILTDGNEVCRSVTELILAPQSEVDGVRKYLRGHAYRIADENMIFEDGKYYPLMRVLPEEDETLNAPKDMQLFDRYGPLLLQQKHPVLRQYLAYQSRQLTEILSELDRQPPSPALEKRIGEIREKLEYNRAAARLM